MRGCLQLLTLQLLLIDPPPHSPRAILFLKLAVATGGIMIEK
jgi:hypothetical protein